MRRLVCMAFAGGRKGRPKQLLQDNLHTRCVHCPPLCIGDDRKSIGGQGLARVQRPPCRPVSGLTLLELVLAVGLFALLSLAIFQLLDSTLVSWRKSEVRRNQMETCTSVLELIAKDLSSLEGGSRGDLLVEWETFDTNSDGARDSLWPRLRFVRQASAADAARLAHLEGRQIDGPDLTEVCWAVLPTAGDPSIGTLWRGERLIHGGGNEFLDESFIHRDGYPSAGALDELTGGILWFQVLLATQTSLVHDGWTLGHELESAATSWDAWTLERPDDTRHEWNEAPRGMPRVDGKPLLPRRVRIAIEYEDPSQRRRRTRLSVDIGATDVAFEVDNETRVPRPGAFVRIDAEWMQVKSKSGRRISVARGARGTEAMAHDVGTPISHGGQVVREVRVPTYREDWKL